MLISAPGSALKTGACYPHRLTEMNERDFLSGDGEQECDVLIISVKALLASVHFLT